MKTFFKNVMEWKISACLMFTGTTIIYMIIAFVTGQKALELSTLFSMLIISALGTLIQFAAFTDAFFKNMRYSVRLIIFVIPFAALLAGCAFWFKWFPTEYAGSWLLFTGIFLLVFVALTFAFEIYYTVAGKKYDGLLGQYKKQKENNQNK